MIKLIRNEIVIGILIFIVLVTYIDSQKIKSKTNNLPNEKVLSVSKVNIKI